jgi:S1-C subfamily serine protease
MAIMEEENPRVTASPAVTVKSRPVSFCGFAKEPGAQGGLIVQTVDARCSAAQAGIAVGDEVLALNGTAVSEPAQAMALLQSAGVGAVVTVQVLRGSEQVAVAMTVQAKSLALDLDDIDEIVERKIAPAAS